MWEAPIPNENRDMFQTLEYIVRGLYRHDLNTPLPPECPVSVAHIETQDARRILQPLTRLPHRGPTIKGHVVVWWVCFHPTEDPLATLWVLMFNDAVYFLGGTGAVSRVPNDAERQRRRTTRVRFKGGLSPSPLAEPDWRGSVPGVPAPMHRARLRPLAP